MSRGGAAAISMSTLVLTISNIERAGPTRVHDQQVPSRIHAGSVERIAAVREGRPAGRPRPRPAAPAVSGGADEHRRRAGSGIRVGPHVHRVNPGLPLRGRVERPPGDRGVLREHAGTGASIAIRGSARHRHRRRAHLVERPRHVAVGIRQDLVDARRQPANGQPEARSPRPRAEELFDVGTIDPVLRGAEEHGRRQVRTGAG